MLLELPNPEYQNLQNSYQHLKDIKINEHDKKLYLSVHVIPGVSDYTRIKTQERPKVSEPKAELTKLDWVRLKRRRFNYLVDTGRKLNVHKKFRRRPGRHQKVLCTFNLRSLSTG